MEIAKQSLISQAGHCNNFFLIIYNIFSPFGSFVPYIGMVTIIMNDYPKFKVSKLEYL